MDGDHAAPIGRRAVPNPRSIHMSVRLLVVVFAVVCAPLAGRSADEDNPYKNAKVGDYASYKLSVKAGGMAFPGTITQTITAKSDKEVTVKTTGSMEIMGNKSEIPAQEQKVDLTKPYDPTNVAALGALPPGTDLKIEKGKEGKEKITLGGKEYDSTWTNFTLKGKAAEQGFNADVKMWTSKDMPLGFIKMVMTSEVAKMKIEMTMELTESGNKK
jgi:hypothetical protein